MKSSYRLMVFILALTLSATAVPKPKEKEAGNKPVDSGSFGIFMNGRRVGTETFVITQDQNGSVIHSEFKSEGTADSAAQTSELQLTPSGDIRRYEWKELSPGKGQSVVLPNEEFLNQRWSAGPGQKEGEQPYLLPHSTTILDDYFFVHREVLAWRFFASVCKQENGQLQCPLKQRTSFGTLNPHQRNSSPFTMEFLGREKVNYHGSEVDLLKIGLKNDAGDWQLWLDNQLKLQRITIPEQGTEVVRD